MCVCGVNYRKFIVRLSEQSHKFGDGVVFGDELLGQCLALSFQLEAYMCETMLRKLVLNLIVMFNVLKRC